MMMKNWIKEEAVGTEQNQMDFRANRSIILVA